MATTATNTTKKATAVYFTPAQVAQHNFPEDCWVSWLGCVYNLTDVIKSHAGDKLLIPILANAGQDLSHWFDPATGNLKSQTHLLTGCKTPYTPIGRFLQVPPPLPRTDWKSYDSSTPWWTDQANCIGYLSKKTRNIRILNMLTKDEHILEVCSEDSLSAIQERYLELNIHAKGYMWKRLGGLLDMNLTLQENGVKDEEEMFDNLGMNSDQWLPVIHLYFSDDLTVA